jgi:hypothetical protein
MESLIIFIPAVLMTLFFKFFWHEHITTKESMISLGANILASAICLGLLYAFLYGKLHDREVISGQVTGKARVQVSCSHSYSCNCRTTCSGSGSNRTCSERCDTCYDHPWDIDWDVYTTLGTYTIDRTDRRGLEQPERWSIVKDGEPVADTNSYRNYLLADPNSLFVELKQGTHNSFKVPDYPNIYDYWKINRVIGPVENAAQLNMTLNERLKTMGPSKQLNVVVVATKEPKEFYNALMANWRGGKKNDVIMVHGLDDSGKVIWFKANSYAMGQGNIELLLHLEEISVDKKLDEQLVLSQLALIEQKFVRLPAKEFEFKASMLEPPIWAVFMMFLINLAISFFVSKHMKDTDNYKTVNNRLRNYRR